MCKQSFSEVIVVDYGCQQGTAEWVRTNFENVKTILVDDDPSWCASRARNISASNAVGDWFLFIDADVKLKSDLGAEIIEHCRNGFYYRSKKGGCLTGSFICQAEAFKRIEGYDEAFTGWGGEDIDLYKRLSLLGIKREDMLTSVFEPVRHGDELRNLGKDSEVKSKDIARTIYNAYIKLKFDFYHKRGDFPALSDRKIMMAEIKNQVISQAKTESLPQVTQQIKSSLTARLKYYKSSNANLQFASVKKIWIYKNICSVIDFSYRNVNFAFNLTPNKAGGVDVDLLQRKGESKFLINKKIGDKKNLGQNISIEDAIDEILMNTNLIVNQINCSLIHNT